MHPGLAVGLITLPVPDVHLGVLGLIMGSGVVFVVVGWGFGVTGTTVGGKVLPLITVVWPPRVSVSPSLMYV